MTTDRLYLRAVAGEALDIPPVWLMRQAGRYLPEYLQVREKHSFLDVCHTPELAVEVTLQPIRRFHFDASILFSDILVPLQPMGADLSFGKGHGPRIANPLRSAGDLSAIRPLEPGEHLPEVLETVTLLRRELPDDVALIGFAGAPFTLATYWIEGGKPEPFAHLKQLFYREPEAFRQLMSQLGDAMATYLLAQAEAGADAVQLFDTWAGVLTDAEFRAMVLPGLRDVFDRLYEAGVPATYFVRGSAHLLEAMGETGAAVVSLDWRVPIDHARRQLGPGAVLQGNLDPTALLGGEAVIRAETRRILKDAQGGPHIFNLGHGILPMTPPEAVEVLLDEIRGGK